ncbi:BNR-4 repeat-containing protein [Paraglaciecola sp.]|uniref:BNR-4 repeat-containing protein n=1 Tax=Paraglaciecola sp. TaxID=1920173 RepID=UPI003EF7671F
MIKQIKLSIAAVVSITVISFSANGAMSEKEYAEKRAALIIKHSHQDSTFAALKNEKQKAKEQSDKGSFTSEYWRLRIDQYLYGQYIEFQPIYDAYIDGKKFNEIYDLPAEDLGPKWQKPERLPAIPKGHFTDNLPGNTYTGWHQLVGDTVYITYQGHLTDPYVASYNLKTDKWDGPYKAGHSTLSKGDRKIDSHGRPIIEVDNQGYIHIVYGGHGGEREDGLNPFSIDTPHAGGRMLHVVSAKPYDLSSFIQKDDISPFASYTKSYKMANGDIYFFTRGGTHKSPWLYYKMKNGTQTFEQPVIISWPTPQKDDPIMVDTHYINPLKISDTEIAITSLWHACNFKEYHDKTHYNRLNLYYMVLDTTDGSFYNAKKEKLALPLTLASTNQHTLAYDSEKAGETSFGTKPLVLEDGRTAAAYEARGKDYREWRMALFENGEWTHGHPMPGTVNRTLFDINGKKVKKVFGLEVLKNNGDTAAVTYQNNRGESVFAIAKQTSSGSTKEQNWQVEKAYFKVAKAKLQMKPVRNQSGNVEALILNVRKGVSQRLYLWHDGKFRAN